MSGDTNRKCKNSSRTQSTSVQVEDSFDMKRCTNQDLCLMGKEFHLCVEAKPSALKIETKAKRSQQFKKLLVSIFRTSSKSDGEIVKFQKVFIPKNSVLNPSRKEIASEGKSSKTKSSTEKCSFKNEENHLKWCPLQNFEQHSDNNFLPNSDSQKCIRLFFTNPELKSQLGEEELKESSFDLGALNYTILSWSSDCVNISTKMDPSLIKKFLHSLSVVSSAAWEEMCDCIEAKTGQAIGKEIIIQVVSPQESNEQFSNNFQN